MPQFSCHSGTAQKEPLVAFIVKLHVWHDGAARRKEASEVVEKATLTGNA